MRRWRIVAPVLAAALLLTGCSEQGSQAPDGQHTYDGVTEWSKPDAVVDFSGPTVDGKRFSSTSARGEVLVVNFWYADCGPCNAEAPVLRTLAKRYASQGVQFVGVNTTDSAGDALGYDRHYGIPYPSILDQANRGAVRIAFQKTVPPSAVPSTIVLDKQGRVVARIIGEADSSVLSTLIEQAVTGRRT